MNPPNAPPTKPLIPIRIKVREPGRIKYPLVEPEEMKYPQTAYLSG